MKLLKINKSSKKLKKGNNSYFSKLSLLSRKTSVTESKISVERHRPFFNQRPTVSKAFFDNTKKLSSKSIVFPLVTIRKNLATSELLKEAFSGLDRKELQQLVAQLHLRKWESLEKRRRLILFKLTRRDSTLLNFLPINLGKIFFVLLGI